MHTWRRPESPREGSSGGGGAASGEHIISVQSGDRLPSGSGKIAADTGVGTATGDRLSLRGTGRTRASSYLEEGYRASPERILREERWTKGK